MVFRGYNRAGHDFEWVDVLERDDGQTESANGEFQGCYGEDHELG